MIFLAFFSSSDVMSTLFPSHGGLIYNLVFDQIRFLKGRIVLCMCFAHFPFV